MQKYSRGTSRRRRKSDGRNIAAQNQRIEEDRVSGVEDSRKSEDLFAIEELRRQSENFSPVSVRTSGRDPFSVESKIETFSPDRFQRDASDQIGVSSGWAGISVNIGGQSHSPAIPGRSDSEYCESDRWKHDHGHGSSSQTKLGRGSSASLLRKSASRGQVHAASDRKQVRRSSSHAVLLNDQSDMSEWSNRQAAPRPRRSSSQAVFRRPNTDKDIDQRIREGQNQDLPLMFSSDAPIPSAFGISCCLEHAAHNRCTSF